MIKIHVYRAVDAPELNETYVAQHKAALEHFGVEGVTSATPAWCSNPDSWVVVATDTETDELVGGVRVQAVGSTEALPMETAIGPMASDIYEMVRLENLFRGAGELCGLWVSRSVKKRGVSQFLIRSAISICEQLGLRTIFGICAEYSFDMFSQLGYTVIDSVGDNGTFPYPSDKYVTSALIMDAFDLETASEETRTDVFDLREDPYQIRMEMAPEGPEVVEYDLDLTEVIAEAYAHGPQETTALKRA